jgi:hypothetical protein
MMDVDTSDSLIGKIKCNSLNTYQVISPGDLNLSSNYVFSTFEMENFISILTSLDRRSKVNEKYIQMKRKIFKKLFVQCDCCVSKMKCIHKNKVRKTYRDITKKLEMLQQMETKLTIECQKLYNFYIQTKYKYDNFNCIVTPPPNQITPEYRTLLKRLLKNDSDEKINGNLQTMYEGLKKIECVHGDFKSQLQGRNSILKQVVLPPKVNCVIRGTILATYKSPDVIGLPQSLEPKLKHLKFLSHLVAITFKRDPVLNSGAFVFIGRVEFVSGDCIHIHPTWLTPTHGDIDGDTFTGYIIPCERSVWELYINLSPQMAMYRPFGQTRLEFLQVHAVRFHNNADKILANTKYAQYYNVTKGNTLHRLNETLLTITLLESSLEAYNFVKYIDEKCMSDNNCFMISMQGNKCPITDQIVESGAKGTHEMLNSIRENYPKSPEEYIADLIKYPNEFITQSKSISIEGYALNTFFATQQFVEINYNHQVTYNGHILVDHVDKLMPAEILIPPSVAKWIFDNNE